MSNKNEIQRSQKVEDALNSFRALDDEWRSIFECSLDEREMTIEWTSLNASEIYARPTARHMVNFALNVSDYDVFYVPTGSEVDVPTGSEVDVPTGNEVDDYFQDYFIAATEETILEVIEAATAKSIAKRASEAAEDTSS